MPEPSPPIVKLGRTTTGNPRSATVSRTSSMVKQTRLRADSPPTLATMSLKLLPVLAALDGLEVGADQFDAVFLEHAVLVERDRGVQRGLAAEGGQQRVDLVAALGLLGDHLLDEAGVIGST